ncbi:RNA-binding protein [Kitasatospora herbaricolor]|uniref:RNA-binding protein n=1 Tax=Kitasatospora herbaricolor TaxID=68217 RepID=A0ABZ1WFZ5_9ACTN|nr:RNA-binding protein [Kitasatospora herbaricolor]
MTKYDPADRDEHDRYTGTQDSDCDHGPVEAAYLAALAAFAEEAGITELTVRDPEYHGAELGEQRPAEEEGMAALFRPDLTGFHDGATVSPAVALEMVRVMLRESGGWCRLESDGRFFVHVGYDQYSYVGSAVPVDRAVARTAALGLFADRITASPYEPEPAAGPAPRAADDAFWAETAGLAASRDAVLLQEVHAGNSARWHRLRAADVPGVRTRLTPRAVLHVRPDLSTDLPGVLAAALAEEYAELVWQDGGSRIFAARFDERDHGLLPGVLAGARAASLVGYGQDAADPLLSAVLPDADGVVRVRRPF